MTNLKGMLVVGGLVAALGSGCGNDAKSKPDVAAPNYDSLRPIVAEVIGCEEILALETDIEQNYIQFDCNEGKTVIYRRITGPCMPPEREGTRTVFTAWGTLDEMFEQIVGCSLRNWEFRDYDGNGLGFICKDGMMCGYDLDNQTGGN